MMHHKEIDVEKSIARKQLIFAQSVWKTIEDGITNVILIIAIGLGLGTIFTLVYYNGLVPGSESYLPAILLFGLLGAIRIYTMNRLKSVEVSHDQAKDMEFIRAVARDLQWKMHYGAKDYVALIPNHTILFSWGFHFFVIIDPLNNRILYKSVAYGRNDMQSPFHLWGCYKYEKKFKKAVIETTLLKG